MMRDPAEPSLVLLQSRGLGDTVVLASTLRGFAPRQMTIFGKPANLELLRHLGVTADSIPVPFPASTGKSVSLLAMVALTRALWRGRRKRFQTGINLFPDVREDAAFRLVRPRQMWRARYPSGHPVPTGSRGTRFVDRWGFGTPIDVLPAQSIYESYLEIFRRVGVAGSASATAPAARRATETTGIIGLHPFAGHACREWPLPEWAKLAAGLEADGHRVEVCCEPRRAPEVHAAFQAHGVVAKSTSTSMSALIEHIRGSACIICADSLPSHLGRFFGVPTIVINGAGDPAVWSAGATVVSSGDRCPVYPCHGTQPCRGTSWQHICVSAVPVQATLDAVRVRMRAP